MGTECVLIVSGYIGRRMKLHRTVLGISKLLRFTAHVLGHTNRIRRQDKAGSET